jgi:hypothetical protein
MHGCMWLHARPCQIGRELYIRGTIRGSHAVGTCGVFQQVRVQMSLAYMQALVDTMVIWPHLM